MMITGYLPRSVHLPFLSVLLLAACATPEERSDRMLQRAVTTAHALPRTTAIVVWHNKQVLAEGYFNGAEKNRPDNVKSVSKCVISALVGIAIDQGRLRLDQTVAEVLPEYFDSTTDARKRQITVEHLLTMRAGLRSVSEDQYPEWSRAGDRVRAALEAEVIAAPGAKRIYSTGNSHILSAMLTRAMETSTYELADRHIADPLNIHMPKWGRDSAGIYIGGNDMWLSPTGMLRLGITYLNGGVYDSMQVVPAAWVRESLREHTITADGFGYGYGWYRKTSGGNVVHFAWGYGGQFIFIVPNLRLVMVVTSWWDRGSDPVHVQAIHDLLEAQVIPAIVERLPAS